MKDEVNSLDNILFCIALRAVSVFALECVVKPEHQTTIHLIGQSLLESE